MVNSSNDVILPFFIADLFDFSKKFLALLGFWVLPAGTGDKSDRGSRDQTKGHKRSGFLN